MSVVKSEDSKKWINSFVALGAILVGYICIKFVAQMGDWFDLEAKINHFVLLSQGIGALAGLATFIFVIKNKKATDHLQEVYDELVKVIWPDNDSVVKVTVGIVIAVVVLSGIFLLIDFLFKEFLELFY